MTKKIKPFIKLINTTARITQAYTDEVMNKFQLSSGTYPFLLVLNNNEGISQNQISRELNVDKAMSARSIKKLIALGYIEKIEDSMDSRAYKLYLTEEGKKLVPEIYEELEKWINIITDGLNEVEQELVIKSLDKVLSNAKKYKLKTEERDESTWKK